MTIRNPGEATEQEVVLNYGIDDYIHKGCVKRNRIITSVVTAIKAFDQLQRVEHLNSKFEPLVGSISHDLRSLSEISCVTHTISSSGPCLAIPMTPQSNSKHQIRKFRPNCPEAPIPGLVTEEQFKDISQNRRHFASPAAAPGKWSRAQTHGRCVAGQGLGRGATTK